jgi:delta-aminolevulinic acid dehydratase/porphobilinogen synthase
MAYTSDAAVFSSQIASAKQIAGTHPLWAGIGAFRLSSDQIVENAQAARRLGVGGIILFSYDSLADSTRRPGYVSQVGRAAFQF